MGDFYIQVGTLEEDFKDAIDLMGNPKFISELVENLPPDITSEFMTIMLTFTRLSGTKKNFLELSSDEKIAMGEELRKLSRRIRVLVRKVEKYMMEQGS